MNSYENLRSRYISGESLSTDEEAALLNWLNDHPDATESFVVDQGIDSQLRCMARLDQKEPTEKFVQATIRRTMNQSDKDNFQGVIQIQESESSPSSKLFSVSAGLAAGVLVFVGLALAWYVSVKPEPVDFEFATFSNSTGLSWEMVDHENRHFNILKGESEIQFENGTVVQLVAPAEIQLRSPNTLFVRSGSVKLDVPPSAVGFTVLTPLARIVDLGTKFDVDVGKRGNTNCRVRSGVVTFETHFSRLTQTAPIKLTEHGLSRASAEVAQLAKDIRSVTVMANGPQRQFLGRIQANGKSKEFNSRPKLDDFLRRLKMSLKNSPSQFNELWVTSADSASAGQVNNGTKRNADDQPTNNANDSNAGSKRSRDSGLQNNPEDNLISPSPELERGAEVDGGQQPVPAGRNRAQEMLIQQLRSMQEIHQDNPQMKSLLEEMIRQAEGVNNENSQ